MNQLCFECDADDGSLSSEARTLLLCVAIIVVILLVFVAHRLYRAYAERGEIKDAGEMRWVKPSFTVGGSAPLKIYAKICISHYQILTQFRKSLDSMATHVLFATADLGCVVCSGALQYRLPCRLPELARYPLCSLPGSLHIHW
jgi:hypothetical protein